MQTIEQLLRDEFTDPDSTVALERAPLIAGVRRARRRRTAYTGAVATVLAVAAVFGLTQLGRGVGSGPQIGDGEPKTRTVIEAPVFVNREHGYLVSTSCPNDDVAPTDNGSAGEEARECVVELKATEDGGRTWVDRTVPRANSDSPLELAVFDRQTVVLRIEDERWVSRDGGRTWVPGPPTTGSVATIPSGAQLEVEWAGDRDPHALTGITTDGAQHNLPLPANFTIVTGTHAPPAATDGTYWLGCRTPDGKPCVASTRDSGRTWQPVRLTDTPPAADVEMMGVSTVDGRTVLADVWYEPDRPSPGASAAPDNGESVTLPNRLYRSTDGGQTWTDIPLPPGRHVATQVLANGDAIANFDGRIHRLPAGGTSFQPVPGTPENVFMMTPSGPWIVAQLNGMARLGSADDRKMLSLDGANWIELRVS